MKVFILSVSSKLNIRSLKKRKMFFTTVLVSPFKVGHFNYLLGFFCTVKQKYRQLLFCKIGEGSRIFMLIPLSSPVRELPPHAVTNDENTVDIPVDVY